jgi:hypothetical protein
MKNKNILTKVKNLLISIVTLSAWTLLLYGFAWTLIAIGWYLIAHIWIKSLFIPEAVRSTAISMFLTGLWIIAVFLSSVLWAKFNYHHHYKQNRRNILPLKRKFDRINWQEASLINLGKSQGNTNLLLKINSYSSSTVTNGFIENFVLVQSFRDRSGKIIIAQNSRITKEEIAEIINKGLYAEFINEVARQAILLKRI